MLLLNNVLKLFSDVWKWTMIVSNKKVSCEYYQKLLIKLETRPVIMSPQEPRVRELSFDENIMVNKIVDSLKKDVDFIRASPSQKTPVFIQFKIGIVPDDGDVRCHITHHLRGYAEGLKIRWVKSNEISLQI